MAAIFDYDSTIKTVVDYNDIVKVQATIKDLNDSMRTLTAMCGTSPVSEVMDSIKVMKSSENNNGAPLVARGSKAIKIGGSKQDFKEYYVDPFVMTDNYTVSEYRQYLARLKNNPSASQSAIMGNFIKMAMRKGYVSLNGQAIMLSNGGVATLSMMDGNGVNVTKRVDVGKIHSNSATDSTLNSFAVTNITTTSAVSAFLKNDMAMTTALRKNGIDPTGATRLLGETLFFTVLGMIENGQTTDILKKGISIGDMGDDYFVLNGKKYQLGTDFNYDQVTGTTTKVVEEKEMKIIGAPKYHLWTYLTPDEDEATSPVLYYAKDWKIEDPSGRKMLFNMRHFVLPDTNAIAKAQMMA